jgi:hypothetical protein
MENNYISYSCLNDRHNDCLYKYQIVRKQTLYGDEFSEYNCKCDCHKNKENDKKWEQWLL